MMRRCVLIGLAVVLVLPSAGRAAEARLLATAQVDRLVVEPGGSVSYEVRVDNVGGADADHVRVTAHLPAHTTAASEHCPEGTVEPDGDVCLQPEVPTPGAGDDGHQVVHSRSPLAAGDGFTFRFRVRIDDDAPVGELLRTHAHAAAPAGAEVTTAGLETRVVARAPRALAGGEALDLSGGVSTDSFDSSAGSFEETRAASGGDLASNGDITIGGTGVVHGDATPGPGSDVTLKGDARVTGSTRPADARFAAHDADAARYAERNANELLCAEAGSCRDSTFSASGPSLRVHGEAVVPPGAYYLCELDVKGRLVVEAPVTLWIAAPGACPQGNGVRFSSDATVEIDSGRPGELRVRLDADHVGAARFELRGGARFTGSLEGPSSVAVLDGGAELFGGLHVGSIVTGSGGGFLHLDRSLRGS